MQEQQALKGETDERLPVKNFNWFIESGTLLGAYRNNKFIPHDDDFDFALLLYTTMVQAMSNDRALVKQQLSVWAEMLKECLPSPYTARVSSTYCDKIEVYDPTQGKYVLPGAKYNGAEFHHVTVDLQAYVIRDGGIDCPHPAIEIQVVEPRQPSADEQEEKFSHVFPSRPAKHTVDPVEDDIFECLYRVGRVKGPLTLRFGDMVPCSTILLEGEEFKCPKIPLAYLKADYGSILHRAVYDPSTGQYVDPLQADQEEKYSY